MLASWCDDWTETFPVIASAERGGVWHRHRELGCFAAGFVDAKMQSESGRKRLPGVNLGKGQWGRKAGKARNLLDLRLDEGIKCGVCWTVACRVLIRGEKRKNKMKRRQDWSGKEVRYGEEEETETGRQKKQWQEDALSKQELWVQQGKALLE